MFDFICVIVMLFIPCRPTHLSIPFSVFDHAASLRYCRHPLQSPRISVSVSDRFFHQKCIFAGWLASGSFGCWSLHATKSFNHSIHTRCPFHHHYHCYHCVYPLLHLHNDTFSIHVTALFGSIFITVHIPYLTIIAVTSHSVNNFASYEC